MSLPTLLLLVTIVTLVDDVWSHGRELEPVSRASAFRKNFNTLPDYNDNGVNCGGFGRQWNVNNGRCGICGDPYDLPTPRPHELGGKFGPGILVANYAPGSIITTIVDLTASHRGFWEFKLCPNPKINDQKCFDKHPLMLLNGNIKYYPTTSKLYKLNYRLPKGVICEHCVLQWRYTAGNNWGDCGNGTGGLGCGRQETFGACSDIAIGSKRRLWRERARLGLFRN